jgi:hypothetical protein
LREAVCPGLRVRGKVAPEMEKPRPVSTALLTVTAADPVELRVSVCVAGALRTTLPKEMDVALMLSSALAAFNCSGKEAVAPLAEAVSEAVWVELTAATVAVTEALVEPAGTVTEAGRETAVLLLARVRARPPVGAAALRVTVHAVEPAPVIELLEQDREAGVTLVEEDELPLDRLSVALKAVAPKSESAADAEPLGFWM